MAFSFPVKSYDWWIKKIKPGAEYCLGEDRWWDKPVISHEDYYKKEKIIVGDLKRVVIERIANISNKHNLKKKDTEAWR